MLGGNIMNFRQLALNNVKGNWRNYKAFLISSCLSIVVFFMYASFIYHPDVVGGNISMREMISKGLESMNYIVVIFSALFILYANSTFLRARKRVWSTNINRRNEIAARPNDYIRATDVR